MNNASKKHSVEGSREKYCATPPFAENVTEDEIRNTANKLKEMNRHLLGFIQRINMINVVNNVKHFADGAKLV